VLQCCLRATVVPRAASIIETRCNRRREHPSVMCGLAPQWEAPDNVPAAEWETADRPFRGSRCGCCDVCVVLAVGPANADEGNHGYLGQRGVLHGGWGVSRSSLQAQLREPTLDCAGHSVLFSNTSSSIEFLSRACDLPLKRPERNPGGALGLPCLFCAGPHAMQAQTASGHPDRQRQANSSRRPNGRG
jgi:hypothetical protein